MYLAEYDDNLGFGIRISGDMRRFQVPKIQAGIRTTKDQTAAIAANAAKAAAVAAARQAARQREIADAARLAAEREKAAQAIARARMQQVTPRAKPTPPPAPTPRPQLPTPVMQVPKEGMPEWVIPAAIGGALLLVAAIIVHQLKKAA